MSNKTRKHIWSGALVLSLAIVGVLAAFVVLGGTPAVTEAHPGGPEGSHCTGESDAYKGLHDAGTPADHPKCANDVTPTPPPTITEPDPEAMDNLVSSSTSASANIKLTLTIAELPDDVELDDGSSIVLYLEDDYKLPDDIDRDDVYFIVPGSDNQRTNNGGRVFPTYAVEIDDDDHFGGDDDWSIQVFLPDFDTRDVDNAEGFQGPMAGETLELVITKAAGINNPSEAHDSDNTYENGYKWSYAVVGPGDDVPDAPGDNTDDDLIIRSKISLDDEDNSRGYELTVTGSGFNNGTSAAVHVLNLPNARYKMAAHWETLNCAQMKDAMDSENNEYCFHYDLDTSAMTYMLNTSAGDRGGHADFKALSADDKKARSNHVISRLLCGTVLRDGSREGIATVGSDDKVAVSFEVTVPTFMAGDDNYICMADGEGRASVSDVEQFKLEPSIRIVPSSAAAGDTVTVFAQDYPQQSNNGFTQLKIAGQDVTGIGDKSTNIGKDGSGTVTFDLPGSLSGSALEGTVRIDARWGGVAPFKEDPKGVTEDTKITITGSALTLSKSEALANELITITGDGFGGDHIDVENITIDGVALRVHDDSEDDGEVEVSNAGQFVASVVLWPHPDAEGGSNPSLIAGTHTIKVEDNAGFSGSAVIIIPEPSISVTPSVAGPRDIITITGENWPIDNVDGADPDAVDIRITDGNRARRYSAFADSAGRFTIEHRVASNVAIPSTNQVRAEMGTDIVKVGSFEVPAAIITVEPAEGQPGDHINLSVDGMPIYQQVARVEIGGRNVRPVGNFSTAATGSVTMAAESMGCINCNS